MTWQPIETAPKDGTAVLAYAAGYGMTTVEWFEAGGYWNLVECGAWADDGES